MKVLLIILYLVNIALSLVLVAIPGVIAIKLSLRLWKVDRKIVLLPVIVYAGYLFVQYVLGVSVWVVLDAVVVGILLGKLKVHCENMEKKYEHV